MKSSRLKRILQNLALCFGTLLICFFLAELTFRLLGYGNLEVYEPNPHVYWRLKPNQECFTKIGRHPVRINSQGTRGPEFSVQKPADTIRILSLGDSRTFGWGLNEEETYSSLLGEKLEKSGTKKKIEVINAGVNAWSFPQMLVYFREYGIKYQPDYVVLADANLWTQFSENNDPEFVQKFMSRVRLKNFLRRFALYHYVIEVQLQDFYARHRTKFIPVDPKQDSLFKEQQNNDPDAVVREAIGGICSLAKSKGIQTVLLHLPGQKTLESGVDASPEILRSKIAASEKFNVPLVEMTPYLVERAKDLYLDADPVHLNAPGNKIIADRLFETMSPMISNE